MSNIQFSFLTESNEINNILPFQEINIHSPEYLFENYKNEIKKLTFCEKLEDNFSDKNINFLNNVVEIKEKIINLNKKYNEYLEKEKKIEEEILKMEKIKEAYNIFNNLYFDFFKKNDDKNDYNDVIKKYNQLLNLPYIADIPDILDIPDIPDIPDKHDICDIFYNITIESKIKNIDNILGNRLLLLTETKKDISNIFEKIKTLKKIINIQDITNTENTINNLCTICDDNNISHCLNPCGHMFCLKCSNIGDKCHTCRSKIVTKIKLFFN